MKESDAPQQSLERFGVGGDDDRPDAEARAVADDAGVATSAVVEDGTRFPDAEGRLDLAVTQVDYTVEGRGSDEYPVVHVFGRTADDEAEHVRVLGVEPYFYVPTDDVAGRDLTEEYDVVLDSRETDPSGERFESIRGRPVTKVVARTPRDVGQIRDDFGETFEADILFPNRFLIDAGVDGGLSVPERRLDGGALQVPFDEVEPADVAADLRVNTFDIEVDDRSGFPEDGEEPILCLTSHDSYDDEYVVWLYVSPDGDGTVPTDLSAYEPLRGEADVRVETFGEEAAMLDAFVSYLTDTDPDVLTGWNFEDFDAPYLLDRMEELDPGAEYDLDVNRLSRVEEVWRSGWGGPNVKGRVVFDLLYAYRRQQFTELESYRLDAVGERELDVGKERYAGDIGDLWETDPERLLEYNLRDVELCVEIDRKGDLVAFWDASRQIVGCKLEDAPTPGDAVDMYVLHKAAGRFVLPTKGQQESEEFEGGAVFDPITGVKENVSVLDLKSLYPMCMATINASPETIVADPERYDGETYRAPNGTHFQKRPEGMMREMIDELLGERERLKSRRDEHDPGTDAYQQYDQEQAAVKVIMNSLYGVSGWDRFRLYDKANAAAITAMGRRVIEFTEEAVNELDHEVTYGDTDSVMLSLDDISAERRADATVSDDLREVHGEMSDEELADVAAAIDVSHDIATHINGRYDDFASGELGADSHRFQIEFEKLYRRFFQAGKKKRYAGHIVWKEGKVVNDVDITGFEYKRSDIAPITKEVQRDVIDMIVHGEAESKIKQYLTDVIEEVQSGDVDLDAIGIPGGIGKRLDAYDTDTAQVRGAKYANLMLGTNFQRGSKPKRLYLEKVHPDFWRAMEDERGLDPQEDPLYGEFKRDPDVVCFEYADQIPDAFTVDYDTMLEKTLRGPISRVIEALGMSWDEVKSGEEQTGLGSFM